MRVCSNQVLYHSLLNPGFDLIESFLEKGLRPLSDFPESERWQQIQTHLPGIFEQLYELFARPVIQKPYLNSGIFLSPIDFQLLPDSLMHNKTRIRVPLERIDPAYAALTYVLDEQRIALPFTQENLEQAAQIWSAEMVRRWFAVDRNRLFFYVPQVAVYQPEGIPVYPEDIEQFQAGETAQGEAGSS